MSRDADRLRILVVEDDERMLSILTRHLDHLGYAVRGAGGGSAALAEMREEPADVVISDVRMPGMDGRMLLSILVDQWPRTRVILMTAFGNVESAVDAVKAGALSYICKPFKVDEIAGLLRNAAREVAAERAGEVPPRDVRVHFSADRLIGPSRQMEDVRRQIREAALAASPVLITGRSGTGKEMAARAIHGESARSGGAFVAVNCSAIPITLFESEMFGHRKGAFTGAERNQAGLVEQSDGGTLFLDEVAEIPLPMQTKLLRVLEEREVRPLGADRPVPVDLRVISATNRSAKSMVREGQFREDLYYRLHVVHIRMPELAERPDDVPALAEHLLAEVSAQNGLPADGLTDEAIAALRGYGWPGNVRELRNTVERALIRTGGRRIGIDDLPPSIRSRTGPAVRDEPEPAPEGSTLAEVEKAHIARILEQCGWNRSAAARILGIDRRTLFSKIKRYGLIGPLR
jgi:DNA-binding NtrC family response regulator